LKPLGELLLAVVDGLREVTVPVSIGLLEVTDTADTMVEDTVGVGVGNA
jgi:hypothetical protein